MKVADQVQERLRVLHPAQRRAVKAALSALAAGKASDVLALTDELEGFYRLRVGRFRVVYRYLPSEEISCEFMDARETVYEQFKGMRELLEGE
jgi:mRNA interferase RelE/StbE